MMWIDGLGAAPLLLWIAAMGYARVAMVQTMERLDGVRGL